MCEGQVLRKSQYVFKRIDAFILFSELDMFSRDSVLKEVSISSETINLISAGPTFAVKQQLKKGKTLNAKQCSL